MRHIGRIRAISAIGVLALLTIGVQGTDAHATSTVYVRDTFTRTVTGGWGSADVGGPWTIQDPSTGTWAVKGGVGKATGTTGQYLVARIAPLTTTRADFAMTFTSTAPATSQPKWLFIVRSVDLLHEYKARVRASLPNGAVIVGMFKVVGNTFPAIGAEVTLPGITWSPGTRLRIRADAIGTAPTVLRFRVWRAATAEPSAWTINVTDNEPTMQVAGSWGVVAIASVGAASAKTTFTYDNLLITSV